MIHLHPKALEMIASMRVTVDHKISDIEYKIRPWNYRLFTFPWRPWVKYESYYCPKAYVLPNGNIAISPKTKTIIDRLR